MGFLVLAKHGLNLKRDLRPIWSHFGQPKNGNEERRRERREEEERKRGRREEEEIKQKGMELLTLSMNLDFWYGYHSVVVHL